MSRPLHRSHAILLALVVAQLFAGPLMGQEAESTPPKSERRESGPPERWLSGPLAKRMRAAGEDVDQEAEFYLNAVNLARSV
jgi:hypothetical protein